MLPTVIPEHGKYSLGYPRPRFMSMGGNQHVQTLDMAHAHILLQVSLPYIE